MRVALFVTCVNDMLYPDTGRAVVTLLERLGVEVDFPAAQTCCGQPQFNTGYRRATEPLVRRMAEAFEGYDHIVTPSGSCAAMVRDNYPRMGAQAEAEGRGRELAAAAATLAPRTYELTEFLVDVLGVTDVGAYFPHTVTYHPSCHGLRMLGLGERPRRLLEAVRGPGTAGTGGRGGMLRVRRHLRREEPRRVRRDGPGQDPARPRHRRGRALRRGQLLPDAPGRHPAPPETHP